jgi:hypothetical protein
VHDDWHHAVSAAADLITDLERKNRPPAENKRDRKSFPTYLIQIRSRKTRRRRKQQGENATDMTSTFLFEVILQDNCRTRGEANGSPVSDRSVIVEIDSDGMINPATYTPLRKAAREYAKELAPQFAIQVVQKDLPHGFEPPYSVMEIDELPSHLHNCLPKFQGNRFRAWFP